MCERTTVRTAHGQKFGTVRVAGSTKLDGAVLQRQFPQILQAAWNFASNEALRMLQQVSEQSFHGRVASKYWSRHETNDTLAVTYIQHEP